MFFFILKNKKRLELELNKYFVSLFPQLPKYNFLKNFDASFEACKISDMCFSSEKE